MSTRVNNKLHRELKPYKAPLAQPYLKALLRYRNTYSIRQVFPLSPMGSAVVEV